MSDAPKTPPHKVTSTIPGLLEERRKGKPYLGDTAVVSGLVGDFIGGIIDRASQVPLGLMTKDEAVAADKKAAFAFMKVISGQDARYMPVPQWNAAPNGLEEWLRRELKGIANDGLLAKPGGPIEAMALFLIVGTYNMLSRMVGGATEEEMADTVDGLNDDGTRLILGVPKIEWDAPDPAASTTP